jgi:uncharacterized protein (TIGR02266 family)
MQQVATVEAERREVGYHLRVPFSVEVRCASDLRGGTRRYLAHNLSRGGLFLTTMLPLDPGTLLSCRFELPDGQPPLQVLVRVAWVRGASGIRDTPAGMGVRFLDLGQGDLRRLERVIEQ